MGKKKNKEAQEPKLKAEAEAQEKAMDEQRGEDLAGEEPGEAPGSSDQGAAKESKSSNSSIQEDIGSDAEKEKVWKVNCNVEHNHKLYSKGHAIHQSDKDFPELKKKGFLN